MTRLVVIAPSWLGDAVMALPAIADLHHALPDSPIVVAARPSVRPLFEMVDGVERAVDLAAVGSGGFETALLLPNSFHAAWMAWRARIPERWGYAADWRRPLLTRSVPRPRETLHQGAYYQHLLAALGFANGPLVSCVRITEAMRAAGARLLSDAGWRAERPIAALAPGAAYGGAKRWPPERFAALVRRLEVQGIGSVMVGGSGDRATGIEIERMLGAETAVINLIGRTDLATLGGVLTHSRVLVSNDSGAMHFGAAVGVPVMALFGSTDERRTAPLGPRPAAVLTHPVWCRPCMMRECPIDHRCMRGISVDDVWAAASGMV